MGNIEGGAAAPPSLQCVPCNDVDVVVAGAGVVGPRHRAGAGAGGPRCHGARGGRCVRHRNQLPQQRSHSRRHLLPARLAEGTAVRGRAARSCTSTASLTACPTDAAASSSSQRPRRSSASLRRLRPRAANGVILEQLSAVQAQRDGAAASLHRSSVFTRNRHHRLPRVHARLCSAKPSGTARTSYVRTGARDALSREATASSTAGNGGEAQGTRAPRHLINSAGPT